MKEGFHFYAWKFFKGDKGGIVSIMDGTTFDVLLNKVTPYIENQNTILRDSLVQLIICTHTILISAVVFYNNVWCGNNNCTQYCESITKYLI